MNSLTEEEKQMIKDVKDKMSTFKKQNTNTETTTDIESTTV